MQQQNWSNVFLAVNKITLIIIDMLCKRNLLFSFKEQFCSWYD